MDYTINAAVGVPLMTGPAGDPAPVNHVLPAWDLIAGAYGAFALLAAERDRMRTGRGREVRVALSDLAATSLGHLGAVAETLASGDRERIGNDLFGAFGRDFTTADGERLMIVAITPRQWSGLVDALDLGAEVTALEARLGAPLHEEGARFVHRAPLNALVAAVVGSRPAVQLASAFEARGVCWSRYRTLATALAQEPRLFADSPVFAPVHHPSGGYPTPGAAARLPADERSTPQPAPRLGQHTDEILMSLLGLSSTEVARLHDAGSVA